MINIKLFAPSNGSITAPLQRYPWRADEEMPKESAVDSGASAAPIHQADPEAFRYLGEPLLDGDPVTAEDRSLPRAVSFTWQVHSDDKRSLSYDLMISQNPGFDAPLIVRDLPAPSAEVLHLYIATRYFWKVIVRRSGQALAESATWSFTTDSTPPRWIRVPGTTNVRDMGGWPLPGDRIVRQGLLFRASEMNGHIQITDEGKRVLVHELGIRTDLDLRKSTGEAEPVLDPRLVQWINIPALSYHVMLEEEGRNTLRRIFQIFAEASNYPILFHCWGGADRTGTVAFLLHALLGVSKENLIHDYELTSLSFWGKRSRSHYKFQRMLDILTPSGEEAERFTEQVAAYLLTIGVTREAIATIRALLVVDRKDR
jgi:hypothetical protein